MNKQVQRFSIRKLTVGAASVLIGVAFLAGANGQKASADTVESQVPSTQSVEAAKSGDADQAKPSDQAAKTASQNKQAAANQGSQGCSSGARPARQ